MTLEKTMKKIEMLQASAAKEAAELRKKHAAAKVALEKATSEFAKLDAMLKKVEATVIPAATPAATPAPVAAARVKKDGTPAQKPGPKKTAEPTKAKPGPKKTEPKATVTEGVRLKKDGTPAKKPGRKPKAAAAEPETKAAAKPEVKAKAEPKAAKGKQKNRAAEGRRAVLAGERPTLREAMRQVMGTKIMNAQGVYDALKEKGWLPNSNDPKTYVGYTLSTQKDDFEKVADKGRGFYRVKGSASNGAAKISNTTADESLKLAAEILSV